MNNWQNSKTLKDISEAYSSIYEAKKVDQDEDGDNDFADVRIARMVASGVPKEVAIARVKNKSYNKEEFDLDEGLGSAVGRLFGRNKPQKQPTKPESRTETLRKKYNVTSSTGESSATGRKFQRSARLASADKAKYGEGSAAARESSAAHKQYVRAGASRYGANELSLGQSGAKGSKARRRLATMRGTDAMSTNFSHNEEFQFWVNSLLDEGYDLSNYTWEEMFDIYEETDKEHYDIVASYLLENNFAETFENVDKIIENMSEKWILDILDEAREPGVKPYRPGPSGAEVRSGMRSAEQKKKEASAGTTGYGPEEKFKSDWKLAARPTPETSARMDKEKPYAKRMTGPLAREYGSRTAAQVTRTVRGPGEPQAVTFARIKSKPSREIIRRPKADD